jgi:hypothetical protein
VEYEHAERDSQNDRDSFPNDENDAEINELETKR